MSIRAITRYNYALYFIQLKLRGLDTNGCCLSNVVYYSPYTTTTSSPIDVPYQICCGLILNLFYIRVFPSSDYIWFFFQILYIVAALGTVFTMTLVSTSFCYIRSRRIIHKRNSRADSFARSIHTRETMPLASNQIVENENYILKSDSILQGVG